MTIKREALKTRNDAKKGYIKFESTQVPVTPNMGRPTYKLPGPVCNSLVSEYRIVLKRDWTPGAVSVTEYAQKDNSQNNRIQPMSESKDMGKLGHELKVALANSDGKHDLTHVGVGVSQVLPILVMCLLAEADSALVFEQPELHLHPKVQTLLGDFFLSVALCNKQCIVETHSEYLIDRLRFRIAAAEGDILADRAKIYFVEKPGAASAFREVTINEYGAIVDWPEGFFDQSQQQAEEILKAAAMKRKARRNKGDT